MSPTPELTDHGPVEPLLTGAGQRVAARPVTVPAVTALRARSARRRRRRVWGVTALAALAVGVLGGATAALVSSPGTPVEVATASPDPGTSSTAVGPTTVPPATAAPVTTAPTTPAPTTAAPTTAAPTTAPVTPSVPPATVQLVAGPTPTTPDVTIVRTEGDEAAALVEQAASTADVSFENGGVTVWLRLDGDDLTASGSDGARFVEVRGSAQEILLYVLFAQFELPYGLDAPLEDLFQYRVVPQLQAQLEGGDVPSADQLDELLDGAMDQLPDGIDVAPSPRQLERFLRDLYRDVPELDDVLGKLPSRGELRDQLERLGPLVVPLEGLGGDLAAQVQSRLDELRASLQEDLADGSARSWEALRDRLFGSGDQDQGGPGNGQGEDGNGDDQRGDDQRGNDDDDDGDDGGG